MERNWLLPLCAALLFASGAFFGGSGGAARAESFDASGLSASIKRRTNAYRHRQSVQSLRRDRALERAAQDYADFYAANPGRPALWGHEYGGLNPMDRAERAGFGGRCVGENLGWQGTSGALAGLEPVDEKMMAGWIKSRPHRKNLEYRHFDVIGVGAATYRADGKNWIIAVQMFGCSEPMPKGPGTLRFNQAD